jgi:hypothetical protein
MDLARERETWVGYEFDVAEFTVTSERVVEYCVGCGETDPRFSDPTHPDFQAPPTFVAQFVGTRTLPEGFPRFGARGFDAGKAVHAYAPVRPGDRITARSRIHDLYEKTGRSGAMYFIVHRMEFRNQRAELVAVVDWRMVQQGGEG